VHLVFWVNEKKLGDVIDRTKTNTSGLIGLFVERVAGTKRAIGAEFDNFVVTRT
jgi:hypothetical protein